MKFVKLLILAAAICGLIFLIKWVIDITHEDDGKGETDIIVIENPVLKPFIDEYTADWSGTRKWNPELYQHHLEIAAGYKTSKDITEAEYDALYHNINTDVLERLVTILEKQFKGKTLDENEVSLNMSGVETVALNMDPNNGRVAKMRKAWQTYKDTKAFVGKSYSAASFSTGMNGDRTSWTPFDTHKKAELAKRDNYRNAPLYKEYFTDNTYLSTGLASVDSKVEGCRNDYYRNVLNSIKGYYGTKPTFNTDTYFRRMRNVTDEREWASAVNDFNTSWDSYLDNFRTRKRKVSEVSARFKKEAGSNLGSSMDAVVSVYSMLPTKPSIPAKPNFNN
ncbi:MAG: hypothetical protein K2F87_01220 [Muribaculaceae bacterium]|nr:hypothetical protein [Muribaculaceae bacterium]